MEDEQSDLQIVPMADRDGDGADNEALPPGISVSKFDYSVENHFKAMDKIFKLSGESEFDCDQSEIQRLSTSVSFLREWRHFCYQPQSVRFACQSETPPWKDVIGGINLPQFSSAAVPKDTSGGSKVSSHLSKDFVMYIGGLVWALDWCPRVRQRPDGGINVEFIAVAAHPPDSSYHKIGAPLTGRGVIQIWGLLNTGVKDQDVISMVKGKSKKKLRSNNNNKATTLKETQPKRPRGRPRKNPINESVNLDDNNQHVKAQSVQYEGTLELVAVEDTVRNVKPSTPQKPRGRPKKKPLKESIYNFDCSNQHLESLAKCPEDSSKMDRVYLETAEIFSKEDTSATETVKFNSVKPDNPIGGVKKKRMKDNFDSSNQYVQPLAVAFPEDSCKSLSIGGTSLETPKTVAKENNSRNQNSSQAGVSTEVQQQDHFLESRDQQKPVQTYRRKRLKEPIGNINGGVGYYESLPAELLEDSSKTNELFLQNFEKVPGDVTCRNQNAHVQALVVQSTEDSNEMLPEDGIPSKTPEKDSSRKRKGYDKRYSEKLVLAASKSRLKKCKLRLKSQVNGTDLPLLSQKCGSSLLNSDTSSGCGQDTMRSSENNVNTAPLDTDSDSCSISEDVALPRLIMCLAHNGKVAWDVKWRPLDTYANSKHRMGYLAVVLGNGALEVWEVPLPRATGVIFSSCQKEGTDPRFMKLEPVFRCSMLKCGDRQSIPQTVEWSTSSPHDLILAGCHDGVVALWKFSVNSPLKDTRPLLCFSADTVPIRALAWAPVVSDPESENVIVTAGHKGVKFWDIRDPFRPLWDVNPVQRIIYSLDWLPDPRCVVLSFDDGEIQMISLLKAACDVPVTGSPFIGTQLQGLYSYHCSSSSIWSVQVSRLTGMVAYCCSDGTVLRFQLTTKAVDKDPRRNREPHYLCGSLTIEGSDVTVFSPLPDVPFPIKKSSNEWGDTPRSRRGFLSISHQEKRAKEQIQTPPVQPLALCYGNDPGSDSASEKHTPKTKNGNMKNEKTDTKNASTNENVKEVFPPKIVAMHRVRWNMNKGSERWLCYGGAAGIIRCQEIS